MNAIELLLGSMIIGSAIMWTAAGIFIGVRDWWKSKSRHTE